MRYIDIYYRNDNILIPVALHCIQIGEVKLSRSPVIKNYLMADGSSCFYPSACDTASMMLHLECHAEQAEAIAKHARICELIISGMSYGINRQKSPETGVIAYLTGTVQIQQISAKADIYTVQMPLQFEVTENGDFQEITLLQEG